MRVDCQQVAQYSSIFIQVDSLFRLAVGSEVEKDRAGLEVLRLSSGLVLHLVAHLLKCHGACIFSDNELENGVECDIVNLLFVGERFENRDGALFQFPGLLAQVFGADFVLAHNGERFVGHGSEGFAVALVGLSGFSSFGKKRFFILGLGGVDFGERFGFSGAVVHSSGSENGFCSFGFSVDSGHDDLSYGEKLRY